MDQWAHPSVLNEFHCDQNSYSSKVGPLITASTQGGWQFMPRLGRATPPRLADLGAHEIALGNYQLP